MDDPRIAMGLGVERILQEPYSIQRAAHDGTGRDGGTLDYAIVAYTQDNRRVVIGEIWAAGHDAAGQKIRLDARGIARRIVDTLNESD